MAPNPLLHTSTSEPLVDVSVPLNAADPPFAEGILASHEADQRRSPVARARLEVSATELQQPSNQPYSYIEANTELDEEIAALQQSWLESEQLYRRLSADLAERECSQLRHRAEMEELRSPCLSADRAKMERRTRMIDYNRLLEEHRKGLAASGQPKFDWKSLPNFVFACGEYIMGRVRAFLDFFAWR